VRRSSADGDVAGPEAWPVDAPGGDMEPGERSL